MTLQKSAFRWLHEAANWHPVSVHARHEGSGHYTGAFINFAVEEIATRPGRTPPLLDRTLVEEEDLRLV